MKLVRLDNYNITFDDELLLLVPFRKLYQRDKTKDKSSFSSFLTIVYFTYDPRSDYSFITNDEKRLVEVCETNGLKVPKFDKLEQECIELYKKLTTTISQELLKSTKIAVDKVRRYLENMDLEAVDEKGKLMNDISKVTAAIRQTTQLSKEVMAAEKLVAKEIEEQGRMLGGNNNKLFEDGFNIQ